MPEPGTQTRQQKKSAETRRSMVAAAVESLVELGYARTTTLEVQRRAGVSRGALLYHFPSKAELLVAAVHHLAEMRGRELKERAAQLPEGRARIDAVLDLLWESFVHPLFHVSMELRTAARTDPDFRNLVSEAEHRLGERILHQSRRLFGEAIANRPGFDCAIHLTLQLMMGAAMTATLHSDEGRVQYLITKWKALFPTLLDEDRGEA